MPPNLRTKKHKKSPSKSSRKSSETRKRRLDSDSVKKLIALSLLLAGGGTMAWMNMQPKYTYFTVNDFHEVERKSPYLNKLIDQLNYAYSEFNERTRKHYESKDRNSVWPNVYDSMSPEQKDHYRDIQDSHHEYLKKHYPVEYRKAFHVKFYS